MKFSARHWLIAGCVAAVGIAALWYLWPAPELSELHLLVLAHDWQRARRGLERYVRRHPDDGQALLMLATVYRELGDRSAALETLQRVPAGSEFKARAVFEEGELHWANKRTGQAERSWQQAIKLSRAGGGGTGQKQASEPTLWALARLADLYLLLSRDDEARHVLWLLFNSVPKTDPAAVDLLLRLTALELEEENPKNAIAELEPCAAAEPENLNVRAALLLYYLRAGMPEKAGQLARQLADSAATSPHLWNSLVRYYVQTGDRVGIRQTLAKLPAEPEHGQKSWNSRVWTYRGIDHENFGELQQALDCYRRAVALWPRSREANSRLAQAARLAGRQDEFKQQIAVVKKTADCISKLSQYIGRLPKFPGNTLSAKQCQELGQLCEALSWRHEALAWHELALARDPELSGSKEALTRLQKLGVR